jgi:16S rRNA (uracil1498-N3)-methyltransferase
MRAVYISNLNDDGKEEIKLSEEATHHLNVVRVKKNEKVIILNGKGVVFSAEVKEITKNEISLKILNSERKNPLHHLSLAIALPKKDAFEDILKISVELGISKIYPLTTAFSQYDFVMNERVNRILESSLVQSNNPFMPEVFPQQKIEYFLKAHSKELFYFNSQASKSPISVNLDKESTFIIGPEAGFSADEESLIRNYSKIHEIHLNTPIMRAPTAVAAAAGYLLR